MTEKSALPDWVQNLISGWPIIRDNPGTFIVVCLIIVGVIWWIMEKRYGDILQNQASEISLLKSQVQAYKDRLGGASPDEAKGKIESLERVISLTIGSRWSPLTEEQIAELSKFLAGIPKTRASVMYENALGKDLAASIHKAFVSAGWTQAELTTGGGLGDGVVVGWSTVAARVGEEIHRIRPDIKTWVKDQGKEIPDLVIVGVGLKTN